MSKWSIDDSRRLYGINGALKRRFLDIDDDGYFVIRVGNHSIRVKELLEKHGLVGAYIRVLPYIRYLMDRVYSVFTKTLKEYGYRGGFTPVYPLKANNNVLVVETIYRHGSRYKWGFNLNTLREVEIIERFLESDPRLIVVDGVKSTAILDKLEKFRKHGWRVVVDIEGERDAELLENYDFETGIRIKYLSGGEGPWRESVGLDSKFGLSLTSLYRILKKHDWIYSRTVLLHVHPGSQIHSFKEIYGYFREAANMYNQLRETGFNKLELVDFGGGLAYPYYEYPLGVLEAPDYGLEEYARSLVKVFTENTDHPSIVFEGGRYITALHRLVVSRVIEVKPYDVYLDDESLSSISREVAGIKSIDELEKWVIEKLGKVKKLAENSHSYSFSERIDIEKLYGAFNKIVPRKVRELAGNNHAILADLLENRVLRDFLVKPSYRFFTAYSIFAHIPDTIVVNQYFQVIPAQRLNEEPEVLAVLSDLTCDSMGEYGYFITRGEKLLFTKLDDKPIEIPGKILRLRGIPLHLPRPGENYYVVFLDTGAYQDSLAMDHNSLGGYPEIVVDLVGENLVISVKPSNNYKY
ncbi:MAG: arginine decarboxylase [Thermoprotei archaeon]